MDWFLYDNGLCHERVKKGFMRIFAEFTKNICAGVSFLIKLNSVELQLH